MKGGGFFGGGDQVDEIGVVDALDEMRQLLNDLFLVAALKRKLFVDDQFIALLNVFGHGAEGVLAAHFDDWHIHGDIFMQYGR